jgi:hypothetical protein
MLSSTSAADAMSDGPPPGPLNMPKVSENGISVTGNLERGTREEDARLHTLVCEAQLLSCPKGCEPARLSTNDEPSMKKLRYRCGGCKTTLSPSVMSEGVVRAWHELCKEVPLLGEYARPRPAEAGPAMPPAEKQEESLPFVPRISREGELERRIASLERENALLKAALQRAGLLGNTPARGYAAAVATPAPKQMVPANQPGTKRVAVQAASQMPRSTGPRVAPAAQTAPLAGPQKRPQMSANTVDRLIRGEAPRRAESAHLRLTGLPPLRLSQVRQVLAACAISRKMVAEIIYCRGSSSYELTVPANLAPGVTAALASKEGSQIRAVPCLPLAEEPVSLLEELVTGIERSRIPAHMGITKVAQSRRLGAIKTHLRERNLASAMVVDGRDAAATSAVSGATSAPVSGVGVGLAAVQGQQAHA